MFQNDGCAALKLVLTADKETTSQLDGQSRICNWLYNNLLERANILREEFIRTEEPHLVRTVYSERGLRNLIPKVKEEHPFLKVVHSSPLKNVALRLSSAISSHQKSKKGKRKGKRVEWPKFRAWKASWFSLLYDEPNKGFRIEGERLILSLGVGEDKSRRSLSLIVRDAHLLKNKEIRNLRITKEGGIYLAIFTIQKSLPAKQAISKVIALDPNHKNLCYGVDTKGVAVEIASPFWLKTYDKRTDELKRKRDRCLKKSHQKEVLDEKQKPIGKTYWEPSRRWKKFHRTLERALHKRREQTKTFLFTGAHALYKHYDCVGIGNYSPKGTGLTSKMRRAMNNRSLIGRFKQVLSWVAQKSGKTFLIYEEEGTTRTCYRCKHRVEGGINPDMREWECPTCRTMHIRDENAALNGLRQVLRDLITKGEILISPVSCSDLVSVVERWAWRVMPSSVHCTLRGQNGGTLSAAAGN